MASPILNEEIILTTLAEPIIPKGPNPHCIASMWAILDAYDRDILRDNMSEIVATAMNLHNRINRLQAMEVIRQALEDGTLSTTFVNENIAGLQKAVEAHRATLIGYVKELTECANDEDSIN